MACLLGHGTTMTFGSFTAEINSLSGPTIQQDSVETTHLSTVGRWREFCFGIKDPGELSLEVNFDPDTDVPVDEQSTLVITWTLPDGQSTPATWSADAFLTSYECEAVVDEKLSASLTFKLSGAITFVDSA
jgi:predicted secreted protein